ncbi:MAG: hypothetical protein ABIA63_12965, partial [bacterium]
MRQPLTKLFFKLKLLLFIAFLGCLSGFNTGCRKDRKDGDKTFEIIKPMVKVKAVETGTVIEKMTFTGILSAWQQADLAPAMQGRVKKILVKEG